MSNVIVHIPVHFKKWGGRRLIIGPNGRDMRKQETIIRCDEKLINALARGYRWRKELETGVRASIEDIMRAEKINSASYIQRMMRLTLLSPKIIEDILNGQQPSGFSLNHTKKVFSPIWSQQEQDLKFKSN